MGRNFNNIKAWQHADDLAASVYSKTKSFPREEMYGLTSQLRRAAVSVPTNIAEGASRKHKKEYLHFLSTARGSIAEVEYLLHLSRRVEYLGENDYKQLEALRAETARTLQGLMTFIENETDEK